MHRRGRGLTLTRHTRYVLGHINVFFFYFRIIFSSFSYFLNSFFTFFYMRHINIYLYFLTLVFAFIGCLSEWFYSTYFLLPSPFFYSTSFFPRAIYVFFPFYFLYVWFYLSSSTCHRHCDLSGFTPYPLLAMFTFFPQRMSHFTVLFMFYLHLLTYTVVITLRYLRAQMRYYSSRNFHFMLLYCASNSCTSRMCLASVIYPCAVCFCAARLIPTCQGYL